MTAPTPLKDRITEDMKAAMRARDADRLGAIRMLLAAVKQREVDERIVADDAVVTAVVDRLIKQRRDSIAQFEQAGRTDLVDREKAELEVLSAYLPAQLSDAEVAGEIDAAIAASGAAGPQDMGKVMGLLKPRLAGRTDLSKVSGLVKTRLAGR
ncbi:MAG TPA: GatB/YqeY domain-containing protein [Burkholderiaceae bacterium]|nr:GatB/YqeY domain-containing protein [Burkholderiaceae bacterium]